MDNFHEAKVPVYLQIFTSTYLNNALNTIHERLLLLLNNGHEKSFNY